MSLGSEEGNPFTSTPHRCVKEHFGKKEEEIPWILSYFLYILNRVAKQQKCLILTIDISALLIFPLWKMKWLLLCVEQFGAVCYNMYGWASAAATTTVATGATAASLLSQRFILDCMCYMFVPYINYIGGLFIRTLCVRASIYICVCEHEVQSVAAAAESSSRGVLRSALLAFHFIFHLVQITMCF